MSDQAHAAEPEGTPGDDLAPLADSETTGPPRKRRRRGSRGGRNRPRSPAASSADAEDQQEDKGAGPTAAPNRNGHVEPVATPGPPPPVALNPAPAAAPFITPAMPPPRKPQVGDTRPGLEPAAKPTPGARAPAKRRRRANRSKGGPAAERSAQVPEGTQPDTIPAQDLLALLGKG